MEAKQLKIIAEGMGYGTKEYAKEPFKGEIQIKIKGLNNYTYYNWYRPDASNNDQCMEIMIFLLDKEYLIDKNFFREKYILINEERAVSFEGKTINEAVCKAAYEYFK